MNKNILILTIFLMSLFLVVGVNAACDVTAINEPHANEYVEGMKSITWSYSGDTCNSSTLNDITYWDGSNWVSTGYSGSIVVDVGTWFWDSTANVDSTSAKIRVDSNTGTFADSDVFTIDNTDPVLDSVSGTTVEGGDDTIIIDFTEENMDESTVENYNNWDVQSPDGTSLTLANAEFSYDDTSEQLTITLNEGTDSTWMKNADDVCVTPTTDVKDLAGNSISSTETCGTISGDNVQPTVTATASPDPAKDGVVTVTLLFSESMDDDENDPTIGFTNNTGVLTTNNDGSWSTTTNFQDTWTETFNLTDANAENTVTVNVTNTPEDLAGNTLDDDNYAGTFEEDTLEPTVTSVEVSDDLILNADVGNNFTVIVNFSESMNTSYTNLINFTPSASNTLDSCSGSWPDSDTYEYECDIIDDNEEIDDINITIDGAYDLAANALSSHTEADQFTIDTKEPTGTLSKTPAQLYDGDRIIKFLITYDEDMNTSVNPTFVTSNGTYTPGSSFWQGAHPNTIYEKTYTLVDNNEDFTVTLNATGGLKDLNGNPEANPITTTFYVDTLNPTVIDINDTDFLYADRGQSVNILIEFSESMNIGVNPSIVESGANKPGWTIGNITWINSTHLSFDYAVPDSDAGLLADVSFVISNAKDTIGNTMVQKTQAITIDTDKPTGTVTLDTNPIYDSDLVQQVTVTYDEDMDNTTTPNIAFDAGNATSNNDGSWISSTVWVETFNFTDDNVDVEDVNTTSSGAKDVSGNNESVSVVGTFDIDTLNPVGNVSVDTKPIYEDDLQQVVTITYNETMDNTPTPTITFTGNSSSITTLGNGAWSTVTYANDTWTETFNVTDENEETDVVTVSCSAATDVAGNVEAASNNATFEIDTIKPEVDSATASPNPAKAGTVTVTVVFNETMNNTISPTVTVEDLNSSSYTVNESTYSDTTWTGTFTLENDQEEATGRITVSGAKDLAGNTMTPDTSAGTFESDTIAPLTESVEANPQDVFPTNATILFMATITDTNGVSSGTFKVWQDNVSKHTDPNVFAADGAFDETTEEVFIITSVSLSEGQYQWTIFGTDNAGNTKTKDYDPLDDAFDNFQINNSVPIEYTNDEIDTMLNLIQVQVDSNDNDITNLGNDIDSLNTTINQNSDDIDVLEINITTLNTNLNNLENDVNDINVTVNGINSDLDDVECDLYGGLTFCGNASEIGVMGRMTAAENDIDALENDVSDLQDDLDAVNGTVTQNAADIDDLEGNVTTLHGQIIANDQDILDLQNNVSDLQDDLDAVNGTVTQNAADIDDLEGNVSDLQNQISANDQDITDLQNNITSLNNDIGALNISINQNSDDIDDLETNITTLHNQILANDQDIEALNNETDDIWDNLSLAWTDIDANTADVDALYNLIDDLEAAMNANDTALQNQIDALENDLDSLNVSLNNLRDDHDALNATVQNHDGRLDDLDNNVTNLNNDIIDVNGTVTQNAADIDVLEGNVTVLSNDLDAVNVTVQDNVARLDVVEGNVTVLSNDLDALEITVNGHTADIATLNADLNNLADDLHDLLSFTINDKTADLWQALTNNLFIETNMAAQCNWTNELNSETGVFNDTGGNKFSAEVDVEDQGINVFTATCVAESNNFHIDYFKDKIIVFNVNTNNLYDLVVQFLTSGSSGWRLFYLPYNVLDLMGTDNYTIGYILADEEVDGKYDRLYGYCDTADDWYINDDDLNVTSLNAFNQCKEGSGQYWLHMTDNLLLDVLRIVLGE